MDEDSAQSNLPPDKAVTRKLFRKWQHASRGSSPAEDQTNPVWQWLFRHRIDPYHAHQQFKTRLSTLFGSGDFPTSPRWAGCRMGQSRTDLPDGRTIWIAGEHEDHYDPDFYIYNDVIVEHPDGTVQFLGFPEDHFAPTDFHSASLHPDKRQIILVGNLGYPKDRKSGQTQVYTLNLESMLFKQIQATGSAPGWISGHRADADQDSASLIIKQGKTYEQDQCQENIDEWSLNLNDWRWTRLTEHHWPRFQIVRQDHEMLHLWNYDMLQFRDQYMAANNAFESTPEWPHESPFDLETELGCPPDVKTYRTLYTPSLPHTPLPTEDVDEDDENGGRTQRIRINDLIVRFVDEMDRLSVTVEGPLDESLVSALAKETRDKLSRIENSDCDIRWID